MQLIDVNSFVPHIEKAPHKIYVIEFSMSELQHFKVASKHILQLFEPFQDIDEKTNIAIDGIDGDKGSYDHANVQVTHGIIMDFRPLMIKIIFWDKPGISKVAFRTLTQTIGSEPIKPIRKE